MNSSRPDIVLIYTDQQRGDALGADGNPHIKTPTLDALAARGARFSRHFVQHPLCMPSRVSMMSGQYPSTLGITDMGVPVPERWTLLPHLLSSVGYHTVNIGKLHFLPHANRDHRRPHPRYGFDHIEISDEPGVYPDAYSAWLDNVAPGISSLIPVGNPPARATWNLLMNLAGTDTAGPRDDYARCDPWPHADGLTHTAFVADRTIAALDERPGEQPVFCVAGFFSPHAPYHVPEHYLRQYDRSTLPIPAYSAALEREREREAHERFSDDRLRMVKHGYYAAVTEVDDHVRGIVDAIEAAGRLDRTVIVVTSDHGEWLGDHLRYAKGPPGDDAISRVPLLISGPDIEPDTVIDDLVEAIDIAPTLCQIAGMQTPPWMQGRSLLDRCRGRDASDPERDAVRMEWTGHRSIRTSRYRYVVTADGSESLWDLESDPGEHHDLAAEPQHSDEIEAALGNLSRRLLTSVIASERPRPRTYPY